MSLDKTTVMQSHGQNMNSTVRIIISFGLVILLILAGGWIHSWSFALSIVNVALISAVMALGVNIQWGYAGIVNIGIMGFTALGGLAAVLISQPPIEAAIRAGGSGILLSLLILGLLSVILYLVHSRMANSPLRLTVMAVMTIIGFIILRLIYSPSVEAIEAVDPAKTGFLGGFGLPILISWFVGGLLAAGAAWIIGKIALGLRSDYLAIATLGISEIIIAILKNEEWLARGVKNVTGLSRPVPYERDLQESTSFIQKVANFYKAELDLIGPMGSDERLAALQQLVIDSASMVVKISYMGLFASILVILFLLSNRALNSPWGRMMRAIRDNDEAAAAMGKDVKKARLQVFILGSAVIGIAGAMLTTLDGQFTPTTYQPLRYTFIILVMVIVGGSGNNLGAILGAFLIWFVWIEAEPAALYMMDILTSGLEPTSSLRLHLMSNAPHMRLFIMGLVLLITMRFAPQGILPEAPPKLSQFIQNK